MKVFSLARLLVLLFIPTQMSFATQCINFLQQVKTKDRISIHKDAFGEGSLLEGVPNTYESLKVALSSSLSRDKLSYRDQESINFFTNPSLFKKPPLQLERLIIDQSKETKESFFSCGTCSVMLSSYLYALIIPMLKLMKDFDHGPHQYKDPIIDLTKGQGAGMFSFVFLQGQLVGAVKALGGEGNYIRPNGFVSNLDNGVPTPTFLALRNVIGKNGELLLATGGIYYIEKTFYKHSFIPSVNEQGPFITEFNSEPFPSKEAFAQQFKFGQIEVDRLRLRPVTFIMNDAGTSMNRELLDWALPVGDLADKRAAYSQRWQKLVSALEKISFFVEEELNKNTYIFKVWRSEILSSESFE